MQAPKREARREAQAKSPTPLYYKIYIVLREQILEGLLGQDELLPSEIELAESYKVSRVTIRRTLERLELDGLILRQRGRGTFVRPVLASKPVKADVTGLMENLLQMGLRTKVRVLEFCYMAASHEVAHQLELNRGAIVQKAVRLRSYKGKPFSYATTYVPEEIGRTFTETDLTNQPLLSLLDRAGIRMTSAEQRVTARAADAVVGRLLDVEIGAPLLLIVRVVRDQKDRPVEYIRALYRPDRYEYQVSMTRGTGSRLELWRPKLG